MKTGELKNIHYSKNIKNNILEIFYSMYLKKNTSLEVKRFVLKYLANIALIMMRSIKKMLQNDLP